MLYTGQLLFLQFDILCNIKQFTLCEMIYIIKNVNNGF